MNSSNNTSSLEFDDSLLAEEFDQSISSPKKPTPYPSLPSSNQSKSDKTVVSSSSQPSKPVQPMHATRPAPPVPTTASVAKQGNDTTATVKQTTAEIRPYPGLSSSRTPPLSGTASANTPSISTNLNEYSMPISTWIKLFKKWGFNQERSSSYAFVLNKMGMNTLAKAEAVTFEELNPLVMNEAHTEAILYVIERTCDLVLDGKTSLNDVFSDSAYQDNIEVSTDMVMSTGKDLVGFSSSDDKKQSNKNGNDVKSSSLNTNINDTSKLTSNKVGSTKNIDNTSAPNANIDNAAANSMTGLSSSSKDNSKSTFSYPSLGPIKPPAVSAPQAKPVAPPTVTANTVPSSLNPLNQHDESNSISAPSAPPATEVQEEESMNTSATIDASNDSTNLAQNAEVTTEKLREQTTKDIEIQLQQYADFEKKLADILSGDTEKLKRRKEEREKRRKEREMKKYLKTIKNAKEQLSKYENDMESQS